MELGLSIRVQVAVHGSGFVLPVLLALTVLEPLDLTRDGHPLLQIAPVVLVSLLLCF